MSMYLYTAAVPQADCSIVAQFDRDVAKINVWFEEFKKSKDEGAILHNLQNISEIIWFCQSAEKEYKAYIKKARSKEEKMLYVRMTRFFYKLKRIAWHGGEYLSTKQHHYLELMGERGKSVDDLYKRILSSDAYRSCKQ
ncbi:MAG: hypothetical protein ACI35O_09155 [Bacillaceae bacterium]